MTTSVETDLSRPEAASGSFGHLRFDLLTRVWRFFRPRETDLLDAEAAMRFSRKYGAKNSRAIAQAGARLMRNPPVGKLD